VQRAPVIHAAVVVMDFGTEAQRIRGSA